MIRLRVEPECGLRLLHLEYVFWVVRGWRERDGVGKGVAVAAAGLGAEIGVWV